MENGYKQRSLWLFIRLLGLLLGLTYGSVAFGQNVMVKGSVLDADTEEPLVGVNIIIKGAVTGTTTNINGSFILRTSNTDLPFTLLFSAIGYETKEVEVTQENQEINLSLGSKTNVLGQEVVVSASRVAESILESPVSIEKMDVLDVQNTSADTYYKHIGNMKGVDMTSSSINFQIVNARGFNSTGNTRFVQMIDGMDSQAPALNFPVGSLNGPSDLDVESVELIPGAASALYGANAFNGILLINTKSPFEYQGLSAFAKVGVNHISPNTGEGEPDGAQPMLEGAFRYAKAFNNKFAFKIGVSYSRAEDWYGTEMADQNPERQGDLSFNPGMDQVHAYGDVAAISMPLVGFQLPGFWDQVEAQDPSFGQIRPALEERLEAGDLPNQIVARTPYAEKDLADYGAENLKVNTALHYRITDNLEASYTLNFGSGTTIYTGANRYALSNFTIQQHKLELTGSNFFLKGYATIENSGDSYIVDAVGAAINNDWKANGQWFAEYATAYLTGLVTGGIEPGTANALPASARGNLHLGARGFADQGRLMPGTAGFEQAKSKYQNSFIPNGGKFDDKTLFYHYEGQYNFQNEIKFVDLQVGAAYRLFDLNSNGTIFGDADSDITIQEYGAFVQAGKKILNDKLKLLASVRYDKNENFDGQWSPRASAVLNVGKNSFIRGSFQTGFRNPSTQGQHIDLDVGTLRILGGLPPYAERYNAYENAYTLASVNRYVAKVVADGTTSAVVDPANLALLQPVQEGGFDPVKPEQIKSFEVGYKGLFGTKMMIDVNYYYNIYNDFIVQAQLRKAAGDISVNPINAQALLVGSAANTYQIYTNLNEELKGQGAALGVQYSLPKGFYLNGNYNWNELIEGLGDEYLNEFNTPEHKVNLGFGNRKLTDRIGFDIHWRWQDAFRWESSFSKGNIPAYSTIDMQVSYRMKELKSILKLGGSNIFNERYIQNYGGPTIGAIYYLSITFDELMK
ncbi:TonB-dependent receptor [Rapidithrix thailandica]|uniref:TonB-dependent receptor n=1 Tax=Rapidithrix thailandica TaxID=413964 RepID=A0AAW9S6X1_9BACT